jgi:hypothetical protein
MHARGQAALDILLALVIMLVVLVSLNGVLSSFTSAQGTIALHQQIHEQGRLTGMFLSLHSNRFHEAYGYPTKSGGPVSPITFVDVINDYTRSTGSLSLPPIRSVGYPQGVPCTISVGWPSGTVDFLIEGSDAGLPSDVSFQQSFSSIEGFDSVHSVDADGCGSSIVVEGI